MLDLVEIVKNASINRTWHISILSYSQNCRGVKVPLDHKLLRHFVQLYCGKIEGELVLLLMLLHYFHCYHGCIHACIVHLLYNRGV